MNKLFQILNENKWCFFLNAFNEQHTDLIHPVVHANISRSHKLAVSFENKYKFPWMLLKHRIESKAESGTEWKKIIVFKVPV